MIFISYAYGINRFFLINLFIILLAIFPYLSGLFGIAVYRFQFFLAFCFFFLVIKHRHDDFLLFGFIFIALLIRLLFVDGRLSFSDVSRFVSFSLFLFLFRFFVDNKLSVKFYKTFLFFIGISSLLIFVDIFSISNFYGVSSVFTDSYNRFRYIGVAGQPSGSALIYTVSIYILISLRFNKLISVFFYVFFFSLFVFLIYVTGSRVGFILSLFFIPLLITHLNYSLSKRMFIFFVILVFIGTMALLDVGFSSVYFFDFGRGLGSLMIRFEKWIYYYDLLNESPMSSLLGLFLSKSYLMSSQSILRQPDSGILLFLIDYGLFGLLYISLVFYRLCNRSHLNRAGYCLRNYLIAHLFCYSLFDQIDTLKSLLLITIFFGLLTNYFQIIKRT